MSKILASMVSVLLLIPVAPATAQNAPQTPQNGPPAGNAMGERDSGLRRGAPRPRALEPVKRERFDKIVDAMFRAGDSNRDGLVAIAELRAVIDTRRDAAIRERFARVDGNRNGSITPEEFLTWQKSLGALALDETTALGDGGMQIAENIAPNLGSDPSDVLLASLIVPLNTTVIAEANRNYDGGASLEELLAFEGKKFDAADSNRDGWLTFDEMRPAERGGQGTPAGQRPMVDASAPARPVCPPDQAC